MKKMILYLIGGSGNNYFQMSFAERLKLEGYDITYNTFFTRNNFVTRLLGWKIHPSGEVDRLLKSERVVDRLSFIDLIYLGVVIFFSKIGVFDLSSSSRNKVFFGRALGYWQKDSYLNLQFLKKLKSFFYSEGFEDHLIPFLNSNVIHVRRGDFSILDQLDMEYYQNAINTLDVKDFVIVTNDDSVLGEFKTFLSPDVCIRLSGGVNQLEDFLIMLTARKLVMSNSTFCYWASQIGGVDEVVYPSKLSEVKYWNLDVGNRVKREVSSIFRSQEKV
jgi:hypothetical protein